MLNHHASSWRVVAACHDESWWFFRMNHHDESSWLAMMNHDESSWWIILMNHESSWFIMMIYHDESSRWFRLWSTARLWKDSFQGGHGLFAMGAMTFVCGTFLPWSPFCNGSHDIVHASLPWIPWHLSMSRPSNWKMKQPGDKTTAAKWPCPRESNWDVIRKLLPGSWELNCNRELQANG